MSQLPEITAEQLQEWQGEAPQVVDVRSDNEVSRGMIKGALTIPMPMIPVRASELDPRRPVVVYCASGGRSAQVAQYLLRNGFQEVYNLRGGIQAWSRSYPVHAPEGV
jgi:rhodanese-related sulfurtransferase